MIIKSDKLDKLKEIAGERFPDIKEWTTTLMIWDDGSYEIRRWHNGDHRRIAVVYFHGDVERYTKITEEFNN